MAGRERCGRGWGWVVGGERNVWVGGTCGGGQWRVGAVRVVGAVGQGSNKTLFSFFVSGEYGSM